MAERSKPVTPVKNRFSCLFNASEDSPEADKTDEKKKEDRKRDRIASVRSEPPDWKKETKEKATDAAKNESSSSAPVRTISRLTEFCSSIENFSLHPIHEDVEEEPSKHLPARTSRPVYRWKAERSWLDWCKIARGNGCPWTLKMYHSVLSCLYQEKNKKDYMQLFKSYDSFMDHEMLCLYYLPAPYDRWGGLAVSFLKQRIEEIKDRDLVDRFNRRPKELIVLTGNGNRNQGNKAVIKAAVEEYLTLCKYDWVNDNEGQLTVYFSKKGRGTFEQTSKFAYLFEA